MYSCTVLYFGEIKMNWTERLAKDWNLRNAKLQTRNRKLRFEIAVCLMLKVSNQMVWLTTCFWKERLSSFEFVFFFFSFINLKGRLPVKWTAYEALLYGVYTTKSDVWALNIIWHLKLPCSFLVNYNTSPIPFNLQLELWHSPLRDTYCR